MAIQPTPSSSTDKVFRNPEVFLYEDLPIIVLCDDLRSFTGWAIKSHTQGNYNHAFIIHKPIMCVSQDMTGFHEKSFAPYMTAGIMLKFWRIKDLTPDEKFLINTAIHNRLDLPWWRRGYDFLGTFVGQFLHVKWLQWPWAEFCSEQINDDYLKSVKRTYTLVKEPSPAELDMVFKNNPKIMECLGYFWGD